MKLVFLATAAAYEHFQSTTQHPTEAISCADYGNTDEKLDRILNGSDAKSAWPWIARIGVRDQELHYCAATIISDRFLLTAEHCFSHLMTMEPNDTAQALSNTFITFNDFTNSTTFEMQPEKIFFRPDRYHRGEKRRNEISPDLAILQVPSLRQKANIKAACLPDTPVPDGSRCWVAGWGYTALEDMISDNRDKLPETLQEASLHKLSADYCRDHSILTIIEDESEFNENKHAHTTGRYWREFCAANAIDKDNDGLVDSGADTCAGDSGGPLMCVIDGKVTLAGVTSWGVGCGINGSPGLYADVYKYKEWIEEITTTGGSTETTPPPPTVTYVDVDFIMNTIRSITGPVYCINDRGIYNERKTQRLQQRLDVVNLSLKQMISLKVLTGKSCSIHHAGEVTTDKFFKWSDDEKSYPKMVDEVTKISDFMMTGCTATMIEKSSEIVRRVFQRYQSLLNRMTDKLCFGRQEKVLKTIFKF